MRLFEPGRFDVILMDCRMPVMDGLVATRAVRSAEAGRSRTPIIALTANATDDERKACFDAGMDGYLTKPVSVEALRNTLGAWFQAYSGTPQSACYHEVDEPIGIA
jgi:CheY-like chemotaxis protein